MSNDGTDYRAMRLDSVTELEKFSRYDPHRYNLFLGELNDRIERMPIGGELRASDYLPARQYELFVKLCCWICFVKKNMTDEKVIYEMLDDYSGIRKVNRK